MSGARADRYQMLLHVETDTLQADAEPGRSHLEDGTRVSAETSRRLACDAAVVRVRTSATGDVLDVGRRTRTIPPAIRRALDVRDGGCRFPGCGVRFTEAHHMQHWADGGETKIDNLLLLCRFHHRLVHEEGWRVQWPSGCGPEFESPGGLTIRRATDPPGARSPDPIAALIRENERAGALPTWRTAAAMWKREADVDLGVATRAFEALAESSSSEGQDVSAETRPGAG